MNSETIEEKQLYLRTEILDKGYDAEGFVSFCEERCGHVDLQIWSFQELKEVVSAYLKYVDEKTAQSPSISQEEMENDWSQFQHVGEEKPKEEIKFREEDWGLFEGGSNPQKQAGHNSKPATEIKEKIEKAMSPPSKQFSGGQKKEEQKIHADIQINSQQDAGESKKLKEMRNIKLKVVKSKDLQPLPAINDIVILKTEQKTKNFLQGDYTLYHIKFNPCGHVLQRKFNDFRKLRIILQKIYPHIRMPYLEPEGWLVNTSEGRDQDTLNKFKYMIIEFLKYITMRNDTLKRSKVVRIFTGFNDANPADFKKYENISRPKKFSELCLPDAALAFSEYETLSPLDKYMTNTQMLLADIDSHYQRIRKTMETLYYNYQQVSKSVNDVSNIFQSLENTIKKFNYDNGENKDLRVYEGIKQVCYKMKDTLSSQYTVFKTKIHSLFRFEKENMTTFKEINEIRNKMYNEYLKQGLGSRRNTQTLDVEVDSNILIEQPCRNNKDILRVQNMFWSHFTFKNVLDYWKQLRYKINQQLTLIAYDQLDCQNQNLNFWNSVIKKCVI